MKHYEDSIIVAASADDLFDYINDHKRFSSHMNKSSWMMGGGRMSLTVDKNHGQKIGSHIRMNGKALGIGLSLDEVITRYKPPYLKIWETVGTPKLLVIGHYIMGVEIKPRNDGSLLRVSIDYDLPQTNRWLGLLFSGTYAKWCVQQMIKGTKDHYTVQAHGK